MKTPREKYQNDHEYRMMVDTMVAYLHKCQFTPSEMREMAVLACILYKERSGKIPIVGGFLDTPSP